MSFRAVEPVHDFGPDESTGQFGAEAARQLVADHGAEHATAPGHEDSHESAEQHAVHGGRYFGRDRQDGHDDHEQRGNPVGRRFVLPQPCVNGAGGEVGIFLGGRRCRSETRYRGRQQQQDTDEQHRHHEAARANDVCPPTRGSTAGHPTLFRGGAYLTGCWKTPGELFSTLLMTGSSSSGACALGGSDIYPSLSLATNPARNCFANVHVSARLGPVHTPAFAPLY